MKMYQRTGLIALAVVAAMIPAAAFAGPGHNPASPNSVPSIRWNDDRQGEAVDSKTQRYNERKARWEKMTPAEREAAKKRHAERKAKWEQMTPEERDAAKAKMMARKAKWDKMTPEERAAWKAKKKAKHMEKKAAE
ncbi:MAG: hypothetical protein AB7G06_04280 [Bdellovibrionales bacterium]